MDTLVSINHQKYKHRPYTHPTAGDKVEGMGAKPEIYGQMSRQRSVKE